MKYLKLTRKDYNESHEEEEARLDPCPYAGDEERRCQSITSRLHGVSGG